MVYMYIKNVEKKEAIKQVCGKCGHQTADIGPRDLSKTIGSIIGMPMALDKVKSVTIPMMYVMPEFILFSQVTNTQLDDFLAAYKAAGIEATPLKAVVTPANISWALFELVDHITAEAKRNA